MPSGPLRPIRAATVPIRAATVRERASPGSHGAFPVGSAIPACDPCHADSVTGPTACAVPAVRTVARARPPTWAGPKTQRATGWRSNRMSGLGQETSHPSIRRRLSDLLDHPKITGPKEVPSG